MKKSTFAIVVCTITLMVAIVLSTIIVREFKEREKEREAIAAAEAQALEEQVIIDEVEVSDVKISGTDSSTETTEIDEKVEKESTEESKPEPEPVTENQEQLVICIDAGHGGTGDRNEGVVAEYDGMRICEKEITLKLANDLKAELEAAGNYKVVVTRTEDKIVALDERVKIASKADADFLVSIHINSSSRGLATDNGCLVIATCSNYNDCQADSVGMAKSILAQLNTLGIPLTTDWDADKNGGILQRSSEKGATYPDGSPRDYYGLISQATEAGIPAIIVEHAFLPNESDYRTYLCDDEKIASLAKADAAGIIKYLEGR